MPIQDLNPQEFSKNLAQQAVSYAPEDINDEQKNYIAKKVNEFCITTSDYLIKQYKDQFTDEQATIVIQFIGEWTFHKSIDVIRAGIDSQHWDQILQQVAFAALKAALQAHMEKYDQPKTAAFIELQVKAAYEESIDQLVQSNAIDEATKEQVLSQSNVDKMAEEQGGNAAGTPEEEEKTLKYITIAMLLKNMPQQKINNILKKMDEPVRQKISSCLQIKDLEQKVDTALIEKYVDDLRKNINLISKPKAKDLVKCIKQLQEEQGEEGIINLTLSERGKIQKFLSDCLFEESVNTLQIELSPYVVKIVSSYLKNKLA